MARLALRMLLRDWRAGELRVLALALVLLSAAAAFVTVGIALRERARGRSSARWLMSTVILTSPLVLVLGPLG